MSLIEGDTEAATRAPGEEVGVGGLRDEAMSETKAVPSILSTIQSDPLVHIGKFYMLVLTCFKRL